MDAMATVLDLCGLRQPDGSHARSIAGAATPRRDVYADAGMLVRQPQQPVPGLRIKSAQAPSAFGPGAMLRTPDWKLCLYAEDHGELFDLRADPHETTNRFDDPNLTVVKAGLMQRLTQRMMCFGQMPDELPANAI
jgi:arylsulfatase A-like enzyme